MPGDDEAREATAMLSSDDATVADPSEGVSGPQLARSPALPAGEWVGGRYQVIAPIGRGGYGEVYRVADSHDGGREVALKLHRLRALSRGALDALKGEFALLASLSHPNLAPVHDFAYVEGEYAFFTQTVIDGAPLHDARIDPTSPAGVALLAQLCRALDYLHARGIVHGDVKPGNIVVDPTRGHLTLIDFGVARALGTSASERVVGSPPYMAPELITSGVADSRTDLYALGVTLYQLVAGTVPFRGSATRILAAHVEEQPPSLPPHVPLPFAALVARLIAKDPSERPATIAEVFADLARIARTSVDIDTSETLASHVLSARFVGRDRELGWLVTRGLHPDVERVPVVVVGDAGTGKSRLLRETRQRVQLRGIPWLQVQTPRVEGGPSLLTALARSILGPPQVAALSEEDRIELARALPELRRARERLALPLDPERARARRLGILTEQLVRRFAWHPGVLAVEDLHWATEPEQRELAKLFERAREAGARCFVLLASRPRGLVKEAWKELGARRLALEMLEPLASRALVSTTFGDPMILDGTELGEVLASRPSSALWVQESLRLALEEGRVRRVEGRFERTDDVPHRPLAAVLAARMRRLSVDARRAALAGAVLAREASAAELARASGLKPARASLALSELVRSGVAERRDDADRRPRYAMHDRYGDVALHLSAPRQIRATRRRVGRWLAREHGDDPRVLARAAHELVEAGDEARAVRVLAKASALSRRAGRPEHAVSSLEREVALRARDDPRRTEALLEVYDLALRCGRADAAGLALMELAERASTGDDPRIGAEVLLRGAVQALRDGDVEEAERQAASAVASADGDAMRDLRGELAVVRGQAALARGGLDEALELFAQAARDARATGRADVVARAELETALVCVRRRQDGPAGEAASRAVDAAKASRDPVLVSEALRMHGNAHFIGGRRARALALYRRAVKVARESGGAESQAKALNNVATCAHSLGHVREALAEWGRAIVLKDRVGATASALLTWASMAAVQTILGERAEARAGLERATQQERSDARVASALGWSNLGDLELIEGNVDAAIDSYQRGVEGYRALGMQQLGAHGLSGAIRALLLRDGEGDRARAEALLPELEAVGGEPAGPDDRRRLLTTRALLREALGDAEGGIADARKAARLRRADTSYEDVFGSLVDATWTLAVLLERAGRSRQAAAAAARAAEILERRAGALAEEGDRRSFRARLPLHVAVAEGRLEQPIGRSWTP